METVSTETFTLSKLSDYPLFEMNYIADYRQGSTAFLEQENGAYACSLFTASNSQGGYMLGRNFDWDPNPIVILHTSPSEGYRSISMVNLGFLGIGKDQAGKFMSKIDVYKNKLAMAPFVPVDGMNETGLAVGMAAVPEGSDSMDSGKPVMGSLGIMREILDYAATVDEALEIMNTYRIEFGGGPAVHYLIADAKGDSAIVEYGSGKMNVIRKDSDWQAITNFLLEDAGSEPELMCDRYNKISEKLTSTSGVLSIKEGTQLLSDISQGDPTVEGTQWSSLYDLSKVILNVSIGMEYKDWNSYSIEMK
jgi:choloylglycine hydrolase